MPDLGPNCLQRLSTDNSRKQRINLQTMLTLQKKRYVSYDTVKSVLRGYLKIDKTKVFMENGNLMKVESIAEYSKGSILQYF